jgi:SAM-dependent methyltransferase
LGIYDDPAVYDLAFSYRDVAAEVEVLLGWYRRWGGRARPRAVLEVAAGPGRHAIEMARRGVVAHTVDGSAAMCGFAREQAGAAGVELKVHRGDLIEFEVGRRFDLAVLLLDSASHILTAGDMARHLASVARHVSKGGIYVVELAVGEGRGSAAKTKTEWRVRREGVDLRVRWMPAFGASAGCRYVCEVGVEGRVDGRAVAVSDRLRLRRWSRRAFERCVREGGQFEVAGLAGGYDDGAYERAKAWRSIYVLKRV